MSLTEPPISPLTGNRDLRLLTSFPRAELVTMFRRKHHIDVTAELPGDPVGLYLDPQADFAFFHPAPGGSPAFYDALVDDQSYYSDTKFEFVETKHRQRPGDRVLDVGCGAGRLALALAGADYTGLERSATARAAAAPGTRIIDQDIADHAATSPAAYDIVTCFQVLEHLDDPVGFARSCLACVKPGGLLILGVPNRHSYIGAMANVSLNFPPHHVGWWSATALAVLAGRLGARVDAILEEPATTPDDRRAYQALFIDQMLRFGQPSRLIDNGIWGRVRGKIARMLAGLMPRFDHPEILRGQIIIAVLRRPET